ncbi:MAG: hypothetical protein ABGZ19_09175 [Verrucomicrobiales bacterium]
MSSGGLPDSHYFWGRSLFTKQIIKCAQVRSLRSRSASGGEVYGQDHCPFGSYLQSHWERRYYFFSKYDVGIELDEKW